MTGYIHSMESMGLVDGPGVRAVVFLQGCPLRCRYCHNPDTQCGGGRPVEDGTLVRRLLRFRSYFDRSGGGVTFSGGEPFCQPEALYELGSRFKAAGKHLMCYSGWTFEELLKKSGREEYVGKLLSILDVLVDGRFDISKRSLSLLFRGSSNQRLIDVPASLTNGEAVELPE